MSNSRSEIGPQDFYEIQARQWRKSLAVFFALILFYFFAVGLIALSVQATFGFVAPGPHFFSGSFWLKFVLGVLAASTLIAVFHFYDARKFGAQYILKRLLVRNPEPSDRYHLQFANTIEEMRIAAGLPRVNSYVIPSFAVNSMALIESDGTPAVAVTEGLLADCTRDELQAVAAHELAHISRGDAFYVTLVCSLANFLEKIKDALEPEDTPPEDRATRGRGGASPALIYLVVAFSSIIMHLLSTLLSRERELLADAAAAEISRNPVALARALYKAHLKNTFVGDFSLTYSPLFILAPKLSGESDGFFSRLFNSHPPLMNRVRLLAQMARLEPANIIEQVWEGKKTREKAKGVLYSFDELRKDVPPAETAQENPQAQGNRVWLIQDPGGKWQGPFALDELLFLPYFAVPKHVKNVQEGVEGQAREFPEIRAGLSSLGKKTPVDLTKQHHCPRCDIPLLETFYEGAAIQACRRCRGKLVDSSSVDRILLRREFDFSEALRTKAKEFREQFLINPVKKQKAKQDASPTLPCPNCGYRMLPRPYSYQYFIPVDKCLSCYKVWFDADELEILQILVEKKA
jgi:Zn-dependent protease with chaperone function/Zn-finger nucleic acid-binding protein